MKIVSWNVNGLRSVLKKGFLDWVKEENPDILCLQEIKIQESELPFDLIYLQDYTFFSNSAAKKGYAGVIVYSKKAPLLVNKNLGIERFDREGRMLELKFPDFSLINLYIPHGARDKRNMDYKLEVYDKLNKEMMNRRNEEIILCGDFNVAHEDIDLARPNQNRNNTMFTFEERGQIDELLDIGFVDSFRQFHREGENYSWWPYYRNARERNLGWRIDYAFVSKNIAPKLKDAFILPEITGSDHCPIGVELGIDLI